MVTDSKDVILSEYREKRPIYEGFTLTCEDLVRRLLRFTNFRVHSVTSRTKGIEELAEKTSHPDKQYDKLQDITDLSGVRVITYFSDDVDKIGTLIEQEFKVFPDESVDKRKVLSPDKFGYLSLHYVCTLSDQRVALSEYSAFRGYICEIQVRTILQHAWAEIEHDLGYKVPQGIPQMVRRRFSRLASLLEMGDDEFESIRNELETYAVNIKKEIPIAPSKVLIDRLSLIAFVTQDIGYQKLDKNLVDYAGAELEDITNEYADSRVGELQYVGLKTIQELKSALEQKPDTVMKVFKERIRPGAMRSISRGITLFYLVQALIAERGDLEGTVKALEDLNIGTPRGRSERAIKLIELVHKKP
jgi:ppGpp synthetase/RelA/SpoT-type nucleotidyltranferase